MLYNYFEKQFTVIIELKVPWRCSTATAGGRCNLSGTHVTPVFPEGLVANKQAA